MEWHESVQATIDYGVYRALSAKQGGFCCFVIVAASPHMERPWDQRNTNRNGVNRTTESK